MKHIPLMTQIGDFLESNPTKIKKKAMLVFHLIQKKFDLLRYFCETQQTLNRELLSLCEDVAGNLEYMVTKCRLLPSERLPFRDQSLRMRLVLDYLQEPMPIQCYNGISYLLHPIIIGDEGTPMVKMTDVCGRRMQPSAPTTYELSIQDYIEVVKQNPIRMDDLGSFFHYTAFTSHLRTMGEFLGHNYPRAYQAHFTFKLIEGIFQTQKSIMFETNAFIQQDATAILLKVCTDTQSTVEDAIEIKLLPPDITAFRTELLRKRFVLDCININGTLPITCQNGVSYVIHKLIGNEAFDEDVKVSITDFYMNGQPINDQEDQQFVALDVFLTQFPII